MTPEETADWLAARCGKLTASAMPKAMDKLKNGNSSARRRGYLLDVLGERLTGVSAWHFVNDAMEWGIEHEQEAKDAWVARTGRTIHKSRFYDHPVIANFGATPDGELDSDGLIEVKCPTTPTFIEWVMAGVVPEEHRPQMTAQLLCSGRKWVGFLAYDPRIRDERRQLFMRKFVPTEAERQAVEQAALDFLAEIDEMYDRFVSAGLAEAAPALAAQG